MGRIDLASGYSGGSEVINGVIGFTVSRDRLYVLTTDNFLTVYRFPGLGYINSTRVDGWHPGITVVNDPYSIATSEESGDIHPRSARSTPILWVDGLGLLVATNRGVKIYDSDLNLVKTISFDECLLGKYSIGISYDSANNKWYIGVIEYINNRITFKIYPLN